MTKKDRLLPLLCAAGIAVVANVFLFGLMAFFQRRETAAERDLVVRPLDVAVVRKSLPRPLRPRPKRRRALPKKQAAQKTLRVERQAAPSPTPRAPALAPATFAVTTPALELAPLPRIAQAVVVPAGPPITAERPRVQALRAALPAVSTDGIYGMGDVDERPVRTRKVEPLYPLSARRFGLTGWVRLEYVVTREGSVRDIQVIASHGGRRFEEAAVTAVRQWVYRPATLKGESVTVRGTVRITFKLDR